MFQSDTLAARTDVWEDVNGHMHCVSLKDFLDHFFPANDEACSSIFERLKAERLYTSKKWSNLPSKPGRAEKDYYSPITEIMNTIVGSEEVQKHSGGVKARWIDTSGTLPILTTSNGRNIRPRCSNFAGIEEEIEMVNAAIAQEIEKQTAEATSRGSQHAAASQQNMGEHPHDGDQMDEDQQHSEGSQTDEAVEMEGKTSTQTSRRKYKNVSDDGEQLDKEALGEVGTKLIIQRLSPEHQIIRAAWARTINVFEVKPEGPLDEETIIQLGYYKRQIFRNQPDRLFVFGLILLHRKLSLWYCDRSGFLGTGNNLIDIDESPELFIRVIFNLATLSSERLGYNPYMKRVISNGRTLHSYDAEITAEEIGKSCDDFRWRFTIPSITKGVPNEYETTHLLSVAHSEIMCGRATLLWTVVDKKTNQSLDLKHCWRPIEADEADVTFEGFPDGSLPALEGKGREVNLYNLSADVPPKLVAAFDLPRTRTLPSLRGGLKSTPFMAGHLPRRSEQHLAVDRQLSLMLFSVIGRPVKYFLNLKELLATFEGALRAKESSIGDISPSNILIKFEKKRDALSPTHTSGTLVGLDHAQDLGRKPENLFAKLKRAESSDDERDKLTRYLDMSYFFLDQCTLRLSPRLLDFIRLRHPRVGTAGDEFMDMLEAAGKEGRAFAFKTDIDLTDFDIKFDKETLFPLDTAERKAQRVVRSGTIPFMSHKLLVQAENLPAHSMIHDMESMFWSLLYICLTQGGPCGQRRPELATELSPDETNSTKIRRVHDILYCLFDCRALLLPNKTRVLTHITEDYFEESILNFIHPYFISLRPLLRAWWNVLFHAYQDKSKDFLKREYPLDAFLTALGNTQVEEPDMEGQEDLYKCEIEVRQSYIQPAF